MSIAALGFEEPRCLIRCVYNKSVGFYTRLCI